MSSACPLASFSSPRPPSPSQPASNPTKHRWTDSNVAHPCSDTISSLLGPPYHQQREPELFAAEPREVQTITEVDKNSMMMKGTLKAELRLTLTSETSTSYPTRASAAAPGSPGNPEPHTHPHMFCKLQEWLLDVWKRWLKSFRHLSIHRPKHKGRQLPRSHFSPHYSQFEKNPNIPHYNLRNTQSRTQQLPLRTWALHILETDTANVEHQ